MTAPLRADTDPAADPVGTVRVHPDDDPCALDARRAICTDDPVVEMRWTIFTGSRWVEGADTSPDEDAGFFQRDTDVARWPVQPWWHLAAVLAHPAAVRTPVADLDRDYREGHSVGAGMGCPTERWQEARHALGTLVWYFGRLDGARDAELEGTS